MNRDDLRASLRRQRDDARARMRAFKAKAEAAVANDPRIQAARRRRRLQRAIAIAVLLLLLLLIRCDGPTATTEATLTVVDAGVPAIVIATPPPEPTRRPKPVVASKPIERPDFDAPGRLQAKWVDAFRLQVAARSPRLSSCFNGTDRPGALRWTTLVSRETGSVGSHDFEPMGTGGGLSKAQLDCLTEVLSKPGYSLDGEMVAGLPERVSMVLEF